jgi:hypothetical protein
MALGLQHWKPGARDLGRCEVRDCSGRIMLVEDMGDFYECQCSVCLTREGVGKGAPAPSAGTGRVGRADHEGDAFLGGM